LNAERQRRYRARLACGKIPLCIEVDEVNVTEALVAAGLLSEAEAQDREKLARAIEKIITVWVNGA
jgi:hypothetical protein